MDYIYIEIDNKIYKVELTEAVKSDLTNIGVSDRYLHNEELYCINTDKIEDTKKAIIDKLKTNAEEIKNNIVRDRRDSSRVLYRVLWDI